MEVLTSAVHGRRHDLLIPFDDERAEAEAEGPLLALGRDLFAHAPEFVTVKLNEDARAGARVLDAWGAPLEALELQLMSCVELIRHFEGSTPARNGGDESTVTTAMRNTFWAASLVAGEVVALVRGGYPAGALARWRALFELDIRAGVLMDSGDDEVADRFLAHEQLMLRREAALWQGYSRKIGLGEGLTPGEVAANRAEDAQAFEKYGRIFGGQYGWAHQHLIDNNEKYAAASDRGKRLRGPNLSDLVDATAGPRRTHMRFYTAQANAAVHGATASALGRAPDSEARFLTGPTTQSLWAPAVLTAESLHNVTDFYAFWLNGGFDEEGDLLLAGPAALRALAEEMFNEVAARLADEGM